MKVSVGLICWSCNMCRLVSGLDHMGSCPTTCYMAIFVCMWTNDALGSASPRSLNDDYCIASDARKWDLVPKRDRFREWHPKS